MDDDRERRGRVLLLGKGTVLAHRLARPLAAESDDDHERRARLLLLRKGVVLAHRLARLLAAESDESEQRPVRDACRRAAVPSIGGRVHRPRTQAAWEDTQAS